MRACWNRSSSRASSRAAAVTESQYACPPAGAWAGPRVAPVPAAAPRVSARYHALMAILLPLSLWGTFTSSRACRGRAHAQEIDRPVGGGGGQVTPVRREGDRPAPAGPSSSGLPL